MAPIVSTGLALKAPAFGAPSAESGVLSFAAVQKAFELAARGVVSAIVTAPISKIAWQAAGVPYTDHTEFFGSKLDCRAEMVLSVPAKRLWCLLVTRHMPLRQAIGRLSAPRVVHAAKRLADALKVVGIARPRLALCGLNPHAGEEGLLGGEERRILAPAAASARRAGINLSGPIAADAAWRLHATGVYDGVVSLYHDQALIALKMGGGLGVVNWTLGPRGFIRTSPGHGTAFDIAGKGIASCAATAAAADLACALYARGA